MKRYLSCLLLVLVGCNRESNELFDRCSILQTNHHDFSFINSKITEELPDTVLTGNFKTFVRDGNYFIKDLKNGWQHRYSSSYSNLIVKAFTNKYVLLYCPRSGIIEGFKLFGHWEHDIYLVRRKDSHIVRKIVIEKGLADALILGDKFFLRFLDPEVIYVCPLDLAMR